MKPAAEILIGLLLSSSLTFFSTPVRASVEGSRPREVEVVLGVGAQTLIAVPGSGRLHVSDGRVLRAEDLGAKLRLTGRKAGVAMVTTRDTVHVVTVLSSTAYPIYRTLQNLIATMRGLHLVASEGQVIVHGKLLRLSDWTRLAHAARGGGYVFRADPDPAIRDEVAREFDRLVREAGLPPLDLQFGPATARLSSTRTDLKTRALTVLGPYGFTIETSSDALTLEPLVRVQILVTEIRKTMIRKLGIAWPESTTAQLLPSFQPPGRQPMAIELKALEDSGAGRILASPNLLCRSGKEAQFLAGGEFPIKITTNKRQDVVWKKYGIMLKIKPKADFSGRMSIALETEVSTLDPHRTVDGVPGMLTNRIESHFDLRRSQTIALSGLIKQESAQNSQGLPGLSSLPVLGHLFSSKEYNDHKTELVVFVTPEVLPSDLENR